MPRNICVYSGSANPELASSIAEYLGLPLGGVDLTRFPGGEIFVQYKENIRSTDVFIIQPTSSPPNENLMELLIMIDAAKRASAARVTAVLPFFGYARQDRKDRPRVPITAKLVANLLTVAGANRVISMDIHSEQIQGFFDIPVDHLYCAPILAPVLKNRLGDNGVVVAPDSGSVKTASRYAEMLEAGLAVVAKRRIDASSVASSHLVGEVKNKICVITDDLTSTAGTLCGAAEQLKSAGAKKIFASISHCLLDDLGRKRLLASPIEELITTNTVPVGNKLDGRVCVCDVAPILAESIKRIHEGRSVSSLFFVKDKGLGI